MTDNKIIKALRDLIHLGDAPIGKSFGVMVDKQTLKEAFDLINRLNSDKSALVEHLKKARKQLKTAKSEARKEFAERLLQRKYQSSDWSHGEHPFVVEENDILEVLEEMG